MQTLDDKPETIHLYVVREADAQPHIYPIILSVLALFALVIYCVFTPYRQPEVRAVISVPAVLLPLRTFTAQVAITPTGIRTYPAIAAHGVLTITNGSIIGQSIPAGLTIGGVTTDSAVYVPSGSANGYGWAQVAAHAGNPGKNGNIPALAINSVIGSSIYIRNLSAFSGGRDSYSVKFVTAQDKQVALAKARVVLTLMSMGLHYPCIENHSDAVIKMVITWRCRFVTYTVPSYMRVLRVRLSGKNLLVDVVFTPPQRASWRNRR